MTKLEEVAMAIYSRGGEPRPGVDPLVPWPELEPKYQKYWLELARAALEALREPREEMVRGAYDAGWPTDYRDAYRAMIDAALTEERAGE